MMKATFFCLLTMFFGLSAVSAGTAAVKTEEKAAPAKNEVKAEKKISAGTEAEAIRADEKKVSAETDAKAEQAGASAGVCGVKDKEPSEAELAETVTVERVSTPSGIRYKKGKRIPDLILTADYQSPVVLAELARKDSKVMYILLPTEYSAEQKIMVYPPDKADAFEVKEEMLSRFISFVNPKRVIFLGGVEVVPAKYRLAVEPSYEHVEIEDLNWNINAIILGNLLMDRGMQKKFRDAFRNHPVPGKSEFKEDRASDTVTVEETK